MINDLQTLKKESLNSHEKYNITEMEVMSHCEMHESNSRKFQICSADFFRVVFKIKFRRPFW